MIRTIINEFMTGLKILALGFNTPDETATMFTEQPTDRSGMRTRITSTDGAFGIPDMFNDSFTYCAECEEAISWRDWAHFDMQCETCGRFGKNDG